LGEAIQEFVTAVCVRHQVAITGNLVLQKPVVVQYEYMTFFGYFFAIMQQYIVPFIFAIGLIFLIYGIIQYFIIGPGEEPVREDGRINFIKAFVWFVGGLVLYSIVALLMSFFAWTSSIEIDGNEETRLQNVPNAPTRNR